ncbi:MAG: peptide deformylase [Solirubrobacteraceae bacterium]
MSAAAVADTEIVYPSLTDRLPRPTAGDLKLVEHLGRLGVRQFGDPVLLRPATRYVLPREADQARRAWKHLVGTAARIRRLHDFSNGMGLAAPQLGIARQLVLVAPAGSRAFPLLNPQIIDSADESQLDFEGCLSFFHVRARVPRPAWVIVRSQRFSGEAMTARFDGDIARLVCHEIDHLEGRLYLDRLQPDAELVALPAYRRRQQRRRRRHAARAVA